MGAAGGRNDTTAARHRAREPRHIVGFTFIEPIHENPAYI
jgi:hypothetical protein